jgi:hypothetical protein
MSRITRDSDTNQNPLSPRDAPLPGVAITSMKVGTAGFPPTLGKVEPWLAKTPTGISNQPTDQLHAFGILGGQALCM